MLNNMLLMFIEAQSCINIDLSLPVYTQKSFKMNFKNSEIKLEHY